MEVTLGDLKRSVSALSKLGAADLPVKIAFTLGDLVQFVNDRLKSYDRMMLQIYKELGTSSDGNEYIVPPQNSEQLTSKLTELNSITEFPPFEMIPMSVLEKHNVQLSGIDTICLRWLIFDDRSED